MTAYVSTDCDRCGQLEVLGTQISIVPNADTVRIVYRFRCPRCSTWAVKEADEGIVALLLRSGARIAGTEDTAGGRSPLRAITEADVAAFHEEIDRLSRRDRDV